jgi:transcriptional regulator with XRE-family HTH domain
MNIAEEIQATHRALAWNTTDRRRALRLSLEEAASRAGIASRQWGRIEAGQSNPTLNTLIRVAVVLGVAIGELFTPLQR